jgi:hypothetical protein
MNLGFVLIFKPGQIKARKKPTQTPVPKKGKTTLKSSMFYDAVFITIILWCCKRMLSGRQPPSKLC